MLLEVGMRTISKAEATRGFEELLLRVQDEPVLVRDGARDVAVVISPEAFDRLLARRQTGSPNPLIMKLFREGVAERGAVYKALAQWEAEHPEPDSEN